MPLEISILMHNKETRRLFICNQVTRQDEGKKWIAKKYMRAASGIQYLKYWNLLPPKAESTDSCITRNA